MWEKEKYYRLILKKIIIFTLNASIIWLLSSKIVFADLQKDLINKLTATKTLSFNFKQEIGEKKETGICYIKYPLLMKCDYRNVKKKSIISNGKTIAIIKKKYKKIYYYPIKTTPLYYILQKNRILNLIRNNKPSKIDINLIEFEVTEEKNKLKIYFDKNTLNFKGWETTDAYSNNVRFVMTNLKINNIIDDNFFKIPKESEL